MTQQRRHQHDSVATSRHGQHRLNNAIAITNLTRHWHHTMSWSSTSTTTDDFDGKQTRSQLIPILFTNIFGFRAKASIPLHCLTLLWCIYILRSRGLHLLGAPIRWIPLKDSALIQSAFHLRFCKEDPVGSISTQSKNTWRLLLRIHNQGIWPRWLDRPMGDRHRPILQ
jgi:hypothetical protein